MTVLNRLIRVFNGPNTVDLYEAERRDQQDRIAIGLTRPCVKCVHYEFDASKDGLFASPHQCRLPAYEHTHDDLVLGEHVSKPMYYEHCAEARYSGTCKLEGVNWEERK